MKQQPDRFQFGHFNLHPGAAAGLTLNPHAIIRAEKHLQPFVHVADADAPVFQQSSELFLGDAHAVVLYQEVQTGFRAVGANANGAALDFAAQAVLDGVFNERLQHHAGYKHIESVRGYVGFVTQFIAKSDHLNGQIILYKV